MAKAIVSGNVIDRLDDLDQKLAQLEAILAMTHGDAGESFRNMSDDLQDNFLWTCRTLASDCKELAFGLSANGVNVAARREADHG